MANREKMRVLREQGALNKRAGKVKDPMFQSNAFFDPQDAVQVKYEMVRAVICDGKSVSESSAAFGMSRPTFYEAKSVLEQEGVLGLAPKKTGPKKRHKLTAEIIAFIESKMAADNTLGSVDLVEMVKNEFSIKVHQRSIDRALAAKKKVL